MQTLEAVNIEKQIHDYVLTENQEAKQRLVKHISKNFFIEEERLEDDGYLVETLLQLIREYNPMIYKYNEDIGIYLAYNMPYEEAEEERIAGKNSFYDRMKAKEYIDKYWKNYNPAYPSFHSGGGDCTNFVSQVLYAGGMPWVDDGNPNHYNWFTNWYCKPWASNQDGDKSISLSWKVSISFKRHWERRAYKVIAMSYKEAIERINELSKQVYLGDPVQFCYANGVPYHTLVVTGYAWDNAANVSDIVLASHTIDSNKRSLYNTMLKHPQDYQLRIYVIKEGE